MSRALFTNSITENADLLTGAVAPAKQMDFQGAEMFRVTSDVTREIIIPGKRISDKVELPQSFSDLEMATSQRLNFIQYCAGLNKIREEVNQKLADLSQVRTALYLAPGVDAALPVRLLKNVELIIHIGDHPFVSAELLDQPDSLDRIKFGEPWGGKWIMGSSFDSKILCSHLLGNLRLSSTFPIDIESVRIYETSQEVSNGDTTREMRLVHGIIDYRHAVSRSDNPLRRLVHIQSWIPGKDPEQIKAWNFSDSWWFKELLQVPIQSLFIKAANESFTEKNGNQEFRDTILNQLQDSGGFLFQGMSQMEPRKHEFVNPAGLDPTTKTVKINNVPYGYESKVSVSKLTKN